MTPPYTPGYGEQGYPRSTAASATPVRRVLAAVSLLASAAMGAALLTGAHLISLLIAQAYRPVPVGLITVCVGGGYLIWLLIREAHQRYGAMR